MIRKQTKKLVYLLILFIPLVFLFIRTDIFSPVKIKIIRFTSWPVQILSFPFQEARKLIFYHSTFEEYKKQKQQMALLQTRLISLEETIRENNRLAKLLALRSQFVYSSVAARVVMREPTTWNSSIIIDKGQIQGIKIGQAVVSSSGVVGKIVEIFPSAAKVMLLTDPQFSAAVVLQRSRETAVISGTLQGLCRLRYLDPQTSVQAGDKVITSKMSLSFPEGLLVGEVIQIEDNLHSPNRYIVKPAVTLSQLEEVLVIIQ